MRSRHRIINAEIRSLTDLFVILEKVLWHGFRSSGFRTFYTLNVKLFSGSVAKVIVRESLSDNLYFSL